MINIRNQNRSVRIPLRRLRRTLQRLCGVLKVSHLDLNFLLVNDREILRFNKKFLNHDYVTDVIAFPNIPPLPSRERISVSSVEPAGVRGESGILGDIAISTDTARRQAKEQRHSIFTETKILAIHGLLHLLGYRDKKRADREKMWKKTDQLLAIVSHL